MYPYSNQTSDLQKSSPLQVSDMVLSKKCIGDPLLFDICSKKIEIKRMAILLGCNTAKNHGTVCDSVKSCQMGFVRVCSIIITAVTNN